MTTCTRWPRGSRRGATYPIVEACFLELAEPDIAAGGARCVARGASRVLMIPYFLSAGVHLLRDLTAARDELGRLIRRSSSGLGRRSAPTPCSTSWSPPGSPSWTREPSRHHVSTDEIRGVAPTGDGRLKWPIGPVVPKVRPVDPH